MTGGPRADPPVRRRRPIVPIAVLLLVVVGLAVVPGVALADQTRAGGTVVIGPDERVAEDLTVAAGTVIVHGEVDGDLVAFAGTVLVANGGTVTGDVEAFAGTVQIDGMVDGSISAAAGTLQLGEDATIGGSISAAAGSIRLLGSVDGDVEAGAGSVSLGEDARIGGDLTYAGTLDRRPGASVEGTVTRRSEVAVDAPPRGRLPSVLLGAYAFLVNLLVGALLLLVAPTFAESVVRRVHRTTLVAGLLGLATAVLVPVALLVVAITIVGLPLAVVGGLLFALVLWVGLLLGRYAVGAWLVGFAGVRNRWAALVVGLLVVALVGAVPYVGGLVSGVVTLLGLGGLVLVGRERYADR